MLCLFQCTADMTPVIKFLHPFILKRSSFPVLYLDSLFKVTSVISFCCGSLTSWIWILYGAFGNLSAVLISLSLVSRHLCVCALHSAPFQGAVADSTLPSTRPPQKGTIMSFNSHAKKHPSWAPSVGVEVRCLQPCSLFPYLDSTLLPLLMSIMKPLKLTCLGPASLCGHLLTNHYKTRFTLIVQLEQWPFQMTNFILFSMTLVLWWCSSAFLI